MILLEFEILVDKENDKHMVKVEHNGVTKQFFVKTKNQHPSRIALERAAYHAMALDIQGEGKSSQEKAAEMMAEIEIENASKDAIINDDNDLEVKVDVAVEESEEDILDSLLSDSDDENDENDENDDDEEKQNSLEKNGITIPTMFNNKDEISQFADDYGVVYNAGDTKADLIQKISRHFAD